MCYSGNGYGFSTKTSITIPSTISGSSVTIIGDKAFQKKGLTSVTISSGITTIGQWAFYNNSISSLTLPSTITTINAYGFQKNSLASINLPSNLKTISNWALAENNFTTITIPAGVTTIGGAALNKDSTYNKNLTKIINKTGKSFNWASITGGYTADPFVTGTIKHSAGNITVSAS